MMANWFGAMFIFFSLGIYSKYLPGDIFSNSRYGNYADIAGFTILCLFYNFMGVKTTLITFWSTLMICIPIMTYNHLQANLL